ncbi:hypothetical protein B0H13DRAFT_2333561 [Mycena leptocephala]|nr:hypothetical protein B0H13DRAFT_2333561 [Mycena leptocephala]
MKRRIQDRTTDTNIIKAEPTDLTLDSSSEYPITPPPSKKQRSFSLTPAEPDEDNYEDHEMNFCIEVETPAPPVLSLGPYEMLSSASYSDFLRIVANACGTPIENLVCSSMTWKFDRPKNAVRKPLTNAVGFKIAIKALKARNKEFAFTVFMVPLSAVKKELPWLQDDHCPTPLDFNYTLDELTAPANSVLSAGIDSASNVHLNAVLERYPVDNHPSFPGKRIYNNEIGSFDLNDIKLRAKGNATEERAPVSMHFNKAQTIRPATAAIHIPAPVPAPSNTNDLMLQLLLPALQAIGNSAHTPYGVHPPPFYPHQYPPNFGTGPGPLVPFAPPAAAPRPDSPSIALPRAVSLDEYCERYQIPMEDRRVLTKLGYEPGDVGLKELDKDAWEAAKALPLVRSRILRQHANFMKDVVAGRWS